MKPTSNQQTTKAQGRAKTPVGDSAFADLRMLHSLDDLESYNFVLNESDVKEETSPELKTQSQIFGQKLFKPVKTRPPQDSFEAKKKSVSPCNSQSSEPFILTHDQMQEIQEAHEAMEEEI